MYRLLFVLFFLPCTALAANSTDIGQVSRVVNEIRLVIPKRIDFRISGQDNTLILSANFKSNIILNSIDLGGLEQNKIGSYNLNSRSHQEIVLGEKTEKIYFVSPE